MYLRSRKQNPLIVLLLAVLMLNNMSCDKQKKTYKKKARELYIKEDSNNEAFTDMENDTINAQEKVIQFTTGQQSHLLGKPAPEFTMTDNNGNVISTATTKGKIVVLNFWFTKCKPCVDEMPALNEIYTTYKQHPEIVFASITFNKKDEVHAFFKEQEFHYPAVTDAQAICNIFNVMSYPTNIIIDKNGKYSEYILGGFPGIGEKIEASLEKELAIH